MWLVSSRVGTLMEVGGLTNVSSESHIAVLILGFKGEHELISRLYSFKFLLEHISLPPCFEILRGKSESTSLSGIYRSQQAKIPAYQQRDELCSSSGSGESEEDTTTKENAVGCMSLPKEKLAQSQKKIAQLIKKKMVKQKPHEVLVSF